jgi:MftR C-terminal domain
MIRESLGGLLRNDPERLLTRVRLGVTVPELRARFRDERTQGVEHVSQFLATKRGTPVDDLRLQVIGSALLAAVSVALDRWQRDEGKSDLLGLARPGHRRARGRRERAPAGELTPRSPGADANLPTRADVRSRGND